MNTIHHHQLENRALAYCWSHEPIRNPLVVLHGLGDSSIHTYAPRFANTALQHTPSLFIDLPGFGEASASKAHVATIEGAAEDVAELLGSLKVAQANIFAHSMGANIAIILAAQYPSLVSRLVLAEPLLNPNQSILAAEIARHSEEAFATRRYTMLVRATSLQAHRGDPAALAFLPALKLANAATMHQMASSLIRERESGFRFQLESLQIQRTLLVGEHSAARNNDLHIEGVRVIRVSNAGHMMMAEQADVTAYVILEEVN